MRAASPLAMSIVSLAASLSLASCGSGDAAVDSAPSEAAAPATGMAAVVSCMQERGWPAELDPADGGMLVEGVPPDQDAQFLEDHAACMSEAGQDVTSAALTDDELHELYLHEVETAECLRALGVSIPEISSEQVWVDAYPSGQAFSAYSFVETPDEATWENYNAQCPQVPTG